MTLGRCKVGTETPALGYSLSRISAVNVIAFGFVAPHPQFSVPK
jgi:hypothetical protein